jgi:serine/threonine-protein kinase
MDTKKTKTVNVLGTPSYMSPEQMAGKNVDGRSDLFSLGVTLYQLVTGVLPFGGDSMGNLVFNITDEPHRDVLEPRPDAPPCLRTIIDTLLQKESKNRYNRGTELAAALRNCIAALSSDSQSPLTCGVQPS